MLVKELQSLALDVRVLDKNGEEIKLSTLCNDDDVPAYSYRTRNINEDLRAEDDTVETDDLGDSFLIEDANGDPIIEEVEEFDGFGDYDEEDNI